MRPVHIGCSGWNYRDWRGLVYPQGLSQSRWLEHYATMFDTVEVNATFYRLPTRETVAHWVEATPERFVFSIKASRYLTHIKRLSRVGEGTARLAELLEPLLQQQNIGDHCCGSSGGASTATTSGSPRRSTSSRRVAPLHRVPPPELVQAPVYELLREHRVALVIGDDPSRPFQTHERTADWTYVRLHRGARPAGQLLAGRARDLAAPDRRLAPGDRGLRLRQQRPGGVRGAQRGLASRPPRPGAVK